MKLSNALINKVERIKRFSTSYLAIPETVGSHSFEMILLAINFNHYIKSDLGDICLRIATHDLEEIPGQDVIRPLKYSSWQLKLDIDKANYKLLEKEVTPDLLAYCLEAKNVLTVEGYLAHVADRFQCYMKMKREFELYGNSSMKLDLEEFVVDLNEIISDIPNTNLEGDIQGFTEYLRGIIDNPVDVLRS